MSQPRLPHLGRYLRDRYTEVDMEKRAQIESKLQAVSHEDLMKVAAEPMKTPFDKYLPKSIRGAEKSFNRGMKTLSEVPGKVWQGTKNVARNAARKSTPVLRHAKDLAKHTLTQVGKSFSGTAGAPKATAKPPTGPKPPTAPKLQK